MLHWHCDGPLGAISPPPKASMAIMMMPTSGEQFHLGQASKGGPGI